MIPQTPFTLVWICAVVNISLKREYSCCVYGVFTYPLQLPRVSFFKATLPILRLVAPLLANTVAFVRISAILLFRAIALAFKCLLLIGYLL